MNNYQSLITKILAQINNKQSDQTIKVSPLSSFSNNVYKVQTTTLINQLIPSLEIYNHKAQPLNKNNKTTIVNTYMLKIFRQYLVEFTNKSVENDVVIELAKNKQYPEVHFADEKMRLENFVNGWSPTPQNITHQQMELLVEKLIGLVQIFGCYVAKQSQEQQQLRSIQQMFKIFTQVNRQCLKNHPEAYKICSQYTQKILQPKIQKNLLNLVPQIMVPTHNDCHLNNVLVTQQGQLFLIDYQFFSLNYRGYQLGNFFNEYATDYQPFEIKQELQLNLQMKQFLIKKYYSNIAPQIQFKQAQKQVEIGRLLSHLFWLFIGVKQIKDPKITIDMQWYIKRRYEEFMKIYNNLLSMN